MGVGGGYYPDTKITDKEGDYLKVFADGGILTHPVAENYQFYFHTIIDVPGVVAANNFMSVFNPSGSGKTMAFFSVTVNSYAIGVSATATSLVVDRITAASGGTQVTASNINRLLTSWSNPVTELRTGNPAATKTGPTLFSWPPPLAAGAGGEATAYSTPPPGQGFICAPGQGIVFSTAAGNTNQVWSINVNWAEF